MADPVKSGSNGHPPNGKTASGLFAPGNKFAKGNPSNRRMQELRQEMLDAVPKGTVATLTKKLAFDALNGDLDAAKVFLSYVVGKPPQAIELTGADGSPLGVSFGQFQVALMAAVAPFGPEAKVAIGQALMSLVRPASEGETNGTAETA